VTSLTFAFVLQASLVATGAETGAETYEKAHEQVAKTGQPLMVLVGADWCPACKQMERQVIPQVRRRGLLGKVAFAIVNLDRERRLGRQLTEGGPIPQVIMYRKTRLGWKRRRLVGAQDVQTLENFINQGLTLDQADKKGEKDQGEGPAVQKAQKKKPRSA